MVTYALLDAVKASKHGGLTDFGLNPVTFECK